jgi:signal transduction histidine kinase
MTCHPQPEPGIRRQLRTPLTNLQVRIETLMTSTGEEAERREQHLEGLARSISRLTQLVERRVGIDPAPLRRTEVQDGTEY